MVLDVKTRWNSINYMLERFLILYKIVPSILLENQNSPDLITHSELLILKEIRDLMHPLDDLTKKISGDKYAIISTILPLINCVHRATSNFQTTTSIGIDLQKLIIYDLDKRFKDLEIFYDFPLATLLDPRYLYILIN